MAEGGFEEDWVAESGRKDGWVAGGTYEDDWVAEGDWMGDGVSGWVFSNSEEEDLAESKAELGRNADSGIALGIQRKNITIPKATLNVFLCNRCLRSTNKHFGENPVFNDVTWIL